MLPRLLGDSSWTRCAPPSRSAKAASAAALFRMAVLLLAKISLPHRLNPPRWHTGQSKCRPNKPTLSVRDTPHSEFSQCSSRSMAKTTTIVGIAILDFSFFCSRNTTQITAVVSALRKREHSKWSGTKRPCRCPITSCQ